MADALGSFFGAMIGREQARQDEQAAKAAQRSQQIQHDIWLDNVRKAQARAVELMGGLPRALGPQTTTGTYNTNRTSNWSTTPGVTAQGNTSEALALEAVMNDLKNPQRVGVEQLAAEARKANAGAVNAQNLAARSGAGGVQRAMMERTGSGASQIAGAQNAAPIANLQAMLGAFDRASAFGERRTGRKGTNVSSTSGTTSNTNPQDLGSIGALILPPDAYQSALHGSTNLTNASVSPWQPGEIARTEQAKLPHPTFIEHLQKQGITLEQWAQTPEGKKFFGPAGYTGGG